MAEPGSTTTLVVGPGGTAEGELALGLGPTHPSGHGTLRLRVHLDGDVLVSAEPVVGALHRGAEKLFEVRDYRQVLVLANRHDWLSAFSSELGVVLAVERMTGIVPPERAVWARTLLAELNRVLNHLVFLGASGAAPGSAREREAVQAVMEEATGGRVHFMANQVGGLREDLPAGWTGRARAAVALVRAGLGPLADLVLDDAVRASARGLGVLPADLVLSHGVTGPVARASGVDADLRRDAPYLGYGELFGPGGPGRVVVRREGDVLARLECLVEQTQVALDLADAALDRLESARPGPVATRLPKTLTVPEGHTYAATENPLGVNGYHLVSRGGRTPWRLKLRSASFGNVQVLAHVLPGTRLADVPAVLGSFFYVVGDIDR